MNKTIPLAFCLLLTGCGTIGTSSQHYYLAGNFSQYSASNLKIALLPFANETNAQGAEALVRGMAAEVLLQRAGGSDAGFSILDIERTDKILAEIGIDSFQTAMNKPLSEYQSLLDADAVLVGQVSEYFDPSGMNRLEGVAGAVGGASPSVRAYIQLYECGTGKLLWQGMPQGTVVPLLAIGSPFTSMEKASRIFKEGFARSWPFQHRTIREN